MNGAITIKTALRKDDDFELNSHIGRLYIPRMSLLD